MAARRSIWIGAAALLVLAAGSSASAKPRPSVVSDPDWLERPNGDEVSAAYPSIALEFWISGRVTLVCAVDSYGALENCATEGESPTGLGFGSAAISLAPKFRMVPKKVDGRPVVGGSVRIPINFKMREADDIPALPAPQSAAALARARVLVDLLWANTPAVFTEWLDERDVSGAGVEEKTQSEAKQAFADAAATYVDYILTNLPSSYAAVLGADEIDVAISFFRSTAGRKLIESYPFEVDEEHTRAAKNLKELATQQARDEFCLDHDCSLVPDAKTMRKAADTWQPDIVGPSWAEEPSVEQLWAAFPLVPKSLKIPGWSTLMCQVGSLGLLEGCEVAIEQPPGLGFGAAALALAPRFRLGAGPMVYGAHRSSVAVPVEFEVYTREAREPAPPAESAALAVARRVVALNAKSWSTFDDDAADLLALDETGLAPRVKGDAILALRRSRGAWLGHALELEAAGYAKSYSEGELRQLLAFNESSTGRMWTSSRIRDLVDPVFEGAAILAQRKARAQFCSAHACDIDDAAVSSPPPGS